MRLFLFLLIIFSACTNKMTPIAQSKITLSIDSLLSKNQFNGVILVTKGEEILYQKANGFKDLEKEIPLKINDNFFIGSISKQITAVLILIELEKGHLQLTDKIEDHLTEIKQPWVAEITIHHLLTHTHGIINLNEPLAFEIGTKFQYSQLGYGLLANILESINNTSFEEIATDFFAKNGLRNTFHPASKNYRNLVKGYVEGEDGNLQFTKNSLVEYVAAGGFISTVHDLSLWNQLLYSEKLVSKETLALMKTKYATRIHPIFGAVEYGYGLLFQEGEENLQIGALGYVPGFVSACYFYPQSNSSAIILENTARDLDNFKHTFKVHTAIMELIRNEKR